VKVPEPEKAERAEDEGEAPESEKESGEKTT
jgi:hypothetical protein